MPSVLQDNEEPARLAIVAGEARHRAEIAGTLLSFYATVSYASQHNALFGMAKKRPFALIVDETLPPDGGFAFVRAVRRNPDFCDIPILLLVDDYSFGTRDQIHSCGANAWLAKPFRRSQLIRAISNLVNGGVEKAWESLPPLQKKVLNLTVKIFDTISNKIYKGEPIPLTSIKSACTPLVEAIQSNNHRLILDSVQGHDNYTYVHSLHVATHLAIFGFAVGLSNEEQILLASGGLLHDVGKMFIPYEILNKPQSLTPDEFTVMKKHVSFTSKYLNTISAIPRGIVVIAEQHHERLDGTGYPNNLQGAQINDLARMAAIVDIFCALTERRTYKPAMPAEAALSLMYNEMGGHIDIALLGKFRDMLLDAASGTLKVAPSVPPSSAPDPEPDLRWD